MIDPLEILLFINICAIPALFYLFLRNIWVHESRINAINSKGMRYYSGLPTYNVMLLNYWWCWDIDRIHQKEIDKTKS